MQAVVGTPSGADRTEFREVGEPEPGPGEALLEIRAFAINRGELSLLKRRPDGWRPGQDVAGVVLRGPHEGERVVANLEWEGWAQRAVAPASRMAVLPDGVTFEQAASLPIAGLTALRTLRLGGSLLGRDVLITGASGGVGRFAVELAAVCGARVTGVARRTGGLAELGAHRVITDIADAEPGYDLILESVGGTSLATAFGLVAPGGTIVLLGNSSNEPAPLNFFDFFGHEDARLRLYHSYYQGDDFTTDLTILVELIAAGRLHPELGLVDSWRNLNAALDRLAGREVDGKAVLLVD
jgi:NADPH:quinone reductase-like Zn-dependent oxidoreductase